MVITSVPRGTLDGVVVHSALVQLFVIVVTLLVIVNFVSVVAIIATGVFIRFISVIRHVCAGIVALVVVLLVLHIRAVLIKRHFWLRYFLW